MPKVHVLIPAYNNRAEVLKLLECLSRQTYGDTRVVLVDDGSTDGTSGEVERRFPGTVILKGDGGLWWTGANVMGVEHILREASKGDFILIINNDLEVGPDFVSILVDASLRHGRALCGSTLVDYNNRDYVVSGVRGDKRLHLYVNGDRKKIEAAEFDYDVDFLPGRGTIIPVEVFERIGNFNLRKLPHYGADYEFSARARRAGFKLLVSHRARVYARLDITGISPTAKKVISFGECRKLLFSKKSKSNIVYYVNFIWLCSDRGYRLRNSASAVYRILSMTVFKTMPFAPFFYLASFLSAVLLFAPRFAFGRYPLSGQDIEGCGLSLKELIDDNILNVERFRDREFYSFKSDPGYYMKTLPPDKGERVRRLWDISMSYRHKASILAGKLRLIFRQSAVKSPAGRR